MEDEESYCELSLAWLRRTSGSGGGGYSSESRG